MKKSRAGDVHAKKTNSDKKKEDVLGSDGCDAAGTRDPQLK